MKLKFVLENKQNGEIKQYKSLKEISKVLDMDYHQIRSIYSSDKKKFLHPIIKRYCEIYKIYDNPTNFPNVEN